METPCPEQHFLCGFLFPVISYEVPGNVTQVEKSVRSEEGGSVLIKNVIGWLRLGSGTAHLMTDGSRLALFTACGYFGVGQFLRD